MSEVISLNGILITKIDSSHKETEAINISGKGRISTQAQLKDRFKATANASISACSTFEGGAHCKIHAGLDLSYVRSVFADD